MQGGQVTHIGMAQGRQVTVGQTLGFGVVQGAHVIFGHVVQVTTGQYLVVKIGHFGQGWQIGVTHKTGVNDEATFLFFPSTRRHDVKCKKGVLMMHSNFPQVWSSFIPMHPRMIFGPPDKVQIGILMP